MIKEIKFYKTVKKLESLDDFSSLLESINRPLHIDESSRIFFDLKHGKDIRKNLGIIFNHRCSEKEAYRREFNRPCPYCGNLNHMDSIVFDIIEESGIYKLKKTCTKCKKTYITEGSKVKK